MSESRQIEAEVTIDATPAAVWKALTEAEELVRWFPLDAKVKPGLGGSMWISWGDEFAGDSEITVWEPEQRLQVTSEIPIPDAPIKLAVDYVLQGAGGQTTLRLVHSGFGAGAEWEDEFDGIERGWAWFFVQLKHYLERHPGTPRVALYPRRRVALKPGACWDRLLPELRAEPAQPLNEGVTCSASLAGVELHGVVQRLLPPYQFGMTVESLNDALFMLEVEGSPKKDSCVVGFLLSCFGVEQDQLLEIESTWEAVLARLFPDSAPVGETYRLASR